MTGQNRTQVQVLLRYPVLLTIGCEDPIRMGLEPLCGQRKVSKILVSRVLRDEMSSLTSSSQWEGVVVPKTISHEHP